MCRQWRHFSPCPETAVETLGKGIKSQGLLSSWFPTSPPSPFPCFHAFSFGASHPCPHLGRLPLCFSFFYLPYPSPGLSSLMLHPPPLPPAPLLLCWSPNGVLFNFQDKAVVHSHAKTALEKLVSKRGLHPTLAELTTDPLKGQLFRNTARHTLLRRS